ncbi:hypothetical protein EUX98_g5271 [Antrodiella citrinella]|uniref:Polynucleotide 5'-hydroxyl-kinase GRC3 n=1 Tax=Antrodiella citrinella TaxID=2447956 RepID=A0A4S4MUE8_9APHY|nr:hypothetical protein EUX98_g5271 [Antrodiella citrinella]
MHVIGQPSTEYVSEETPMNAYANLHLAFEGMRVRALHHAQITAHPEKATAEDIEEDRAGEPADAPRVLVIGPENSGKTTVSKLLINYATRAGQDWSPMLVNVDPSEGAAMLPGTLSATPVSAPLQTSTPAHSLGSAATSAPTHMASNSLLPFGYWYGHAETKRNPLLMDRLIRNLGVNIWDRWDTDIQGRASGLILDTPSSFAANSGPNSQHRDSLIKACVDAFRINVILVVGHEKLNVEMQRTYGKYITVVKIPKSGGVVELDELYRTRVRKCQMHSYMYGERVTVPPGLPSLATASPLTGYVTGGEQSTDLTLAPLSSIVGFGDLSIWRVGEETLAPTSALPIGATRVLSEMQPIQLDPGMPGSRLYNAVLAVVAPPNPDETERYDEELLDLSVVGFAVSFHEQGEFDHFGIHLTSLIRIVISQTRRLALLAVCLAAAIPSTFADSPKLLKTHFTSTLLQSHSTSHAGNSKLAASSGSPIDAPTSNAVLKVVASVVTGKNQTFSDVLIDTGSAILWVGAEDAFESGPNTKPLGDFSIGYGAGGAKGPAYADTVTIGDATVKSQIIGAANSTTGFNLVKPIDGILGLGPADSNAGQITGHNSTPTFVESLVNEGTIQRAIFGIHISSLDPSSGQEITEGEISFGGVDEDKIIGDVVWLPQLTPTNFRWSFNASSLSFGSLQLVNTTMPARTDTGVLLVGLPFDSMFAVLHAVPGATIIDDGILEGYLAFPSNVTADSLPPLSLGLGNQIFDLPASKYLVPKTLYPSLNLTEDVVYSWMGSAGQGSYMLGQKWLEGIYSAYDMEGKPPTEEASPTSRTSNQAPPPPPPKPTSRLRNFAKYTLYLTASAAVGLFTLTGAIFLHDAFTYTEQHIEGVPVSPLALKPETGGPKNLPILQSFLGDIEDTEQIKLSKKPHLVIVGGGWGAVGVLSSLRPGEYHVTLISPETYNTFTPLLPSAAVGTVSVRSLVEPLRKILARLRGHLINAKVHYFLRVVCFEIHVLILFAQAIDLVMSQRLIEVELVASGKKERIYVPYDKLVIACGSTSATHGVPGLDNCFQLKTISDAQQIRKRIIDNFEAASLPTTCPDDRRRLLSFVVCGGGPTGVETAAEIYDLCQEDIINYYPKVCREDVSIHVIQGREHILNTYSEAISKYAEAKFVRDKVDLITSARVVSVHPDHVTYSIKAQDGKTELHDIPTNFVLWSTGIAMNPFVARVSSFLPNQVHKKAIEVDAHLRVKGAPVGEVYAIGDASTIETSVVSHLLELVDESDKNGDGKIDFDEWQIMVHEIKKRIPMAESQLNKVKELFDLYDSDGDNSLTLNELAVLLQEIGNKITALPATAQVASQQGKYLGRKFSRLSRQRATLEANELNSGPGVDEAVSSPFRYLHLGSLAYIGNAAVFDLGQTTFMGGLMAMYAWRSVYWSEQDFTHYVTTVGVETAIASASVTVLKRGSAEHVSLAKKAGTALTRTLTLLYRLNQCLPVHILPNEVLLKIFLEVVQMRSPSHPWFYLTHVCRRWRNIAQQASSLWTKVNLSHAGLINAYLEHSRNRPLLVKWTTDLVDIKSDPETLSTISEGDFMTGKQRIAPLLVKSYSSRVDSIDIVAPGATLQHILDFGEADTEFVFPSNLGSLRLSRPHKDLPNHKNSVCIADIFLDSAPCQIHTLKLHGVAIFWEFGSHGPFTSHLQVLHISHLSPTHAPQIRDFLRVLKMCPALEELVLDNAGPYPSPGGNSPFMKANLPNLQVFRCIKADEDALQTLMSNLFIPDTARIFIEVNFGACFFYVQTNLPLFFARFGIMRQLKELEIIASNSFVVRGWTTPRLCSASPPDPDFQLQSLTEVTNYERRGDDSFVTLRLFLQLFSAHPGTQLDAVLLCFDYHAMTAISSPSAVFVLLYPHPITQLTIQHANLTSPFAVQAVINTIRALSSPLSDGTHSLSYLEKVVFRDVLDEYTAKHSNAIATAEEECHRSRREGRGAQDRYARIDFSFTRS